MVEPPSVATSSSAIVPSTELCVIQRAVDTRCLLADAPWRRDAAAGSASSPTSTFRAPAGGRTRLATVLAGVALMAVACRSQSSKVDGEVGRPHQVTKERLIAARDEPENWLMYSGQYNSWRYSGLSEIDRSNVASLEPVWTYPIKTEYHVESTPLVLDGRLYLTLPQDRVLALDARTGSLRWERRRRPPRDLSLCCLPVNRGLAILGNTLYWSTLDAHLVALDATDGTVIWDQEVEDYRIGASSTGAPLVIDDLVVTGVAGGDFGIRGFLDAYEAATGRRRWRVFTIPAPGEPGSRTWRGDAWRHGGGATWNTGSYDPGLDLLYWTVGNPSPSYDGDARPGDNLYTNSVLALRPRTGELVWHFQFTPHDTHDWDSNQVPVLLDRADTGRPLLALANKNAFFYVLDRKTGEYLRGRPFARQSWARELDEGGRPILVPDTAPQGDGQRLSPAPVGGTNWWSPSYSPITGLFYVAAYDGSSVYVRSGAKGWKAGKRYLGGAATFFDPQEQDVNAVRALDPRSGAITWESRLPDRSGSGLLATAGQLLFAATIEGDFLALDAETGRVLWRSKLEGRVDNCPISFAIDGEQRIGIATQGALHVFGLRKPAPDH